MSNLDVNPGEPQRRDFRAWFLFAGGLALWCFCAILWPARVNGGDVVGAVLLTLSVMRIMRPVRRGDRP